MTWKVTLSCLALASAASAGCGAAQQADAACAIEGLPDLADEALACMPRGVEARDGVTYWLLPLTPVVVAETGVVPYVIVAANTSQAPAPAALADAAGEWFFDPEDGDPVQIKTISPRAGPAVEIGPGEVRYWAGSVGVWGRGVPALTGRLWANLRLELRDGERALTFRLRLALRDERPEHLDADCWRAISTHRDRVVRIWAGRLPGALLRERAED